MNDFYLDMLGYASLSLSGIEEGMGLLEKAWL